MSQTTFLVTGAARGIGFQIVSVLLKRPSTTVVATVRNFDDAARHALKSLPTADFSSLIIVKLDSLAPSDAFEAVKEMQDQNIAKLDVVIASAGMATSLESVLETRPEDMATHFGVNCVGQLRLFQASYPLLKRREGEKKEAVFCVITSSLGSIAEMEPLKCLAYGCSKAAVNFLVRKIHLECEDIVSFALHPGWVRTGMGTFAANAWGAKEAPTHVEESVDGIMRQIDQATRRATSGKFLSYDGSEIAW